MVRVGGVGGVRSDMVHAAYANAYKKYTNSQHSARGVLARSLALSLAHFSASLCRACARVRLLSLYSLLHQLSMRSRGSRSIVMYTWGVFGGSSSCSPNGQCRHCSAAEPRSAANALRSDCSGKPAIHRWDAENERRESARVCLVFALVRELKQQQLCRGAPPSQAAPLTFGMR